MADAEARFVISIDQSGAMAASNALGGSLEQLKGKIEKGTKALQELQGAALRLKRAADVVEFQKVTKGLERAQADVAKFEARIAALRDKLSQTTDIKTARGLQAQIAEAQKGLDAARSKADKLSAQRDKLSQSASVKAYNDVTAAIKEKESALADMQTRLSQAGGTMERAAAIDLKTASLQDVLKDKFAAVGKMGSFAKATLAVGLAVAFAAIVASAVRAAYSLGQFVVGLADAARTAQIFRDATARSAEGGAALAASIDRVYARVGGVRSELDGLALDLRRLGLEGQALEDSLEAVRATSRVFGQQAGSAIQGLVDRAQLVRRGVLQPLELRGTGIAFADVATALAKNMGVSMRVASAALANGQVKVEAFTRALRDASRARTGEALEKLALSLPEQFERARENLAQIFRLDDTKFLKGLNSILRLLDASSASGQRLRSLVKTVLQPLLNSAEKIFPAIRAFMLGAIAGAIELAIAALDLAIAIKKILPADVLGKFDVAEAAFYAGAIVVALLAGVAVLATFAVAALGGSLLLLASPVLLVGVGLALVIALLVKLVSYVQTAFNGPNFEKAGGSIVDGIIAGVKNKAGDLLKELASLATGGLLSFNKELKIRSPSQAFRAAARNIPLGAVQGVEDEAPRVSRAVAAMASPEQMEQGSGAAPRGAVGGVVYLQVTIDARGSSAASIRQHEGLLEAVVEVLERAVRAAGLKVVQAVP